MKFSEKYRKQGDVQIAEDQIDGINFLLSKQGAILAFQTGTGKTITSLVAMKIVLDNSPNAVCVIVCPVKALKAFKHEVYDRIGLSKDEVGILATGEMQYDEYNNRVFLITDTNIEKYMDLTAQLVARGKKLLLIIDEAHKLQNPESKFYQTMTEIKSISSVVWGLTATPILNELDSLYYITDFFCPHFLGKKTDFDNRYTVWHLEDVYIKGGKGTKRKTKVLDGYKNLTELNQLLKSVMMVRKKTYNLKFGNVSKELTPTEYDIYRQVSSGIIGDEKREFTKRLHDLQRFVDRSYDEDSSIKDLVSQYSSMSISTKEQMLVDSLSSALSKGYGVLIYADYHDTVERLERVLLRNKKALGLNHIYKVTGAVDKKLREQVEDKITDRDVVLITSAGTESINLQKANCIIMYDIPFSVKTIIQLIGRVCRRDTKHKYQYIITLYTKGTIDEYKFLCYQNNLSMVQLSVGAGTDLPLENLEVDKKTLKELKDKLLWHYKGDARVQKAERANRKLLKENIIPCTVAESHKLMASSKFLVEPLTITDNSSSVPISEVQVLYPDKDLYDKYVKGEVPLTVLRAKYLDYLRSKKGKSLIKSIHNNVISKVLTLALVGDTEVPKILYQEILDQYEI